MKSMKVFFAIICFASTGTIFAEKTIGYIRNLSNKTVIIKAKPGQEVAKAEEVSVAPESYNPGPFVIEPLGSSRDKYPTLLIEFYVNHQLQKTQELDTNKIPMHANLEIKKAGIPFIRLN